MTNTIMKNSTTSNYRDNLPDHIHIFSVEDHDYWKPKVLEAIERSKEIHNIKLNNQGYYYDYLFQKTEKTYESIVANIMYPYCVELGEMYGLKWDKRQQEMHRGIELFWFQQYIQGSKFGWHQHSGHWAFVYFVELPEPDEATEFLNYGILKVKEGDILCFPTFLVHRAPEITSNLRKTIISTNQDFEVDREFIGNDSKRFRNR